MVSPYYSTVLFFFVCWCDVGVIYADDTDDCVVRALYNYQATIPEEFDFQANDIIAVTATHEGGWWSGELLDEIRRMPGRHIFPSNCGSIFVGSS